MKRIISDTILGTAFLAVLPAMFGFFLYLLYLVGRTSKLIP